MKRILLSIAAIFTLVTGKAQFSENFNGANINSLTGACWVLSGVSTTTQNGEAINGTSISTAPPTNPGTRIDMYTPILNVPANPTISFDYRLTQQLNGLATRSIEVVLVNLSGIIVASDLITMPTGTNTNVVQYQHTFSPVPAGNYRVAFRVMGAQGNGNVRLVIDNFVVSGATLYNNGGNSCNFVPILEAVLPIKLLNFDAKYAKPNVELNWSTAQEKNFSHFVLEQSTDGINFNQLAIILGAGESDTKKEYSYTDKNITGRKGLVYYRLMSVDIDSKFDYSSVRIIRLDEEKKGLVLSTYPNPAVNELKITIPAAWQSKITTYEVVNMNGQVAKKLVTNNSSQTETMNVSNLVPGFYLVRVTCEGETALQKIIKQ